MHHWKPLEINDKDIINAFLHHKRYETSELSFTNLLLWQFGHKIQWRLAHDMLLLRMVDEHGAPGYYMPVGDGDLAGAVALLTEESSQGNFRLCALSQRMCDELEAAMPGKLAFEHSPGYDDYIYSLEELRDLPGSRFRKKRNFVAGFERENTSRLQLLTAESVPRVVMSHLEWCEDRGCEHYPQLYKEKIGVLKILERFEQMDYRGAYIEVGEKVEAFTFGEMLSDDTVVIHIEKANNAIRGAYQAINAWFLNQWPDAKWVNRECDLGLDGLRKAKESYNPVRKLVKHEARLRR
ncbi:MAG: phosphatidylglycerol lysyltransferase domain-containing protein [Candidatus Cloacimonetes bacterium]|nr:phosphatidylglycerol lysyltransferase domain-containing protein [Candidatus Cloacimonadota bacterium]